MGRNQWQDPVLAGLGGKSNAKIVATNCQGGVKLAPAALPLSDSEPMEGKGPQS